MRPPSPAATAATVVAVASLAPAALLVGVVAVTQTAGPYGGALVLAVLVALPGAVAALVALALRLAGRRSAPRPARALALVVVGLLLAVAGVPAGAALQERRADAATRTVAAALDRDAARCSAVAASAVPEGGTAAEIRIGLDRAAARCLSAATVPEGWQLQCFDAPGGCQAYQRQGWRSLSLSYEGYLDEALRAAGRPGYARLMLNAGDQPRPAEVRVRGVT